MAPSVRIGLKLTFMNHEPYVKSIEFDFSKKERKRGNCFLCRKKVNDSIKIVDLVVGFQLVRLEVINFNWKEFPQDTFCQAKSKSLTSETYEKKTGEDLRKYCSYA